MLGHWYGVTLVTDSRSKEMSLSHLVTLFLIEITEILIQKGSDIDLSSQWKSHTTSYYPYVWLLQMCLPICNWFLLQVRTPSFAISKHLLVEPQIKPRPVQVVKINFFRPHAVFQALCQILKLEGQSRHGLLFIESVIILEACVVESH